uniref:RNA helicase n=1 Tax=Ananas comosus var. bracteatus TaxID=296719 RepID=A0A6V7PA53_ANACO|nr:unnamed protein product [Ananas comosus var. bracteatus]
MFLGLQSVNDELIRDVIAQTSGFMPRDILALVADAGASFVQRVLQRGPYLLMFLFQADLLLSHGHEADLKALIPHIPRSCQCSNPSYSKKLPDVDKLKKLLLHEPVILTISEEGQSNSDLIPGNIEQYWPKPRLLAGKVLIFVNSIDMAFRLRLFLEKFKIRSVVLNAELPQNSQLHILEEFNAGLFGILIVTDDNQTKEKDHTIRESQVQSRSTKKKFQQNLDAKFGVVIGIDFKMSSRCVINFDMPRSPAGYVHRIGRTGRAVTLVLLCHL